VTNPLLQPMPMSADEIQDLIRRARERQHPKTKSARLARVVRWAIRNQKSLAAAAREFLVACTTLRRYWLKRHPGVPILVSKRGGL
jgi:hypothetical protein